MSYIIVDDPKALTTLVSDNVGCISINHNPPTDIVIPVGKMIIHTCPVCNKVTEVRSNIAYC